MNELRWILLVAGILLIVGLYAWGMRSRARQHPQAEPKPPVFTGGATGFEPSPPAAVEDASVAPEEDVIEVPAVERTDRRRVEPSFDDEPPPPAPRRVERAPTFDEELGRASAAPAPGGRREPTIQPQPEPAAVVEPAAPKPARPAQKIVALRVTAPAASRFEGAKLLEALQAEGLTYGRYEIFHRLHDDGRPLFSVASLKEPGTFNLDEMPGTQYPGIAFFTVLPGPVASIEAFDEMMFTARALATHLGGAMADDRGAPLTAHRVGRLREEALEYERTLRPG